MATNVQKSTEKNKFFDIKKRWAHVKLFSYSLAKKLLEECPNSPLAKQYKNTMFCKWFIQLEPYKLADNGNIVAHTRSKYCKNRICPICNRINTAIKFNGYFEPLSKFKEPCFVTLTAPNVDAEHLENEVNLYFSNMPITIIQMIKIPL